MDANAATTEAVLAALRRVTGDEAEIKTTGYSVTPRFEQFEPSTPRKLVGYRVRNSVVLTSSDLKGIGRAIDAAIGAGANDIDSLSFQLRDDFEIRLQALAEATRRARAKADAIAKAMLEVDFMTPRGERMEILPNGQVYQSYWALSKWDAAADNKVLVRLMDLPKENWDPSRMIHVSG